MKPAEKLKRIKLISEKMFCEFGLDVIREPDDHSLMTISVCIKKAKIFVDEFEKFEGEFLKEHEVENESKI